MYYYNNHSEYMNLITITVNICIIITITVNTLRLPFRASITLWQTELLKTLHRNLKHFLKYMTAPCSLDFTVMYFSY